MNLIIFNNSIFGILCAAIFIFLLPFIKSKYLWVKSLSILLSFSVLCILILSNSRSGWLGAFVGAIYLIFLSAKKYWIFKRKRIAFFLALVSFLFLLTILSKYKSDSTKGRLHIYHLSLKLLRENWLHGIGFQKFRVEFNEQQAAYFSNRSLDNNISLLADNTFYAFNDTLQWIIETGIVGFLILVLFFAFLFRRVILLKKTTQTNCFLKSSISTLICLCTASMFSYPIQVIPIQALVLICVGIIIFFPLTSSSKVESVIYALVKLGFIFLNIYFIINSIKAVKRKSDVKKAFELSLIGKKSEALRKYEKVLSRYEGKGDVMLLYAEQLYYTNRLREALVILNHAKKYYVDNKLYRLKATIEAELGLFKEAERDFLHSIYMVPNRMTSRFELMNFYLNAGDSIKARNWAKSIVEMPIKVPSFRTELMLKETKKIYY